MTPALSPSHDPQTDEVFLEAQIQNITTSPMFMEKVSLEPSIMYNVTELNTVESGEEGYRLHVLSFLTFFYVRPSVSNLLWSRVQQPTRNS